MKIPSLLLSFFILISSKLPVGATDPDTKKPKLIVGIVIDQMRYDYLTRYWSHYGEDGFKKLIREGHNFTNTHFNYVPTFTGPGHASIYTGTTPAVHGIIGNDWYSRKYGRRVYVTEDTQVIGVGTNHSTGKMSPRHMLATTVCDELRIASNLRSKVIGVALKDRGAIVTAGHSANGAYWYEGSTGNWISSNWYLNELPGWVQKFNNKKRAAELMSQPWSTLKPIAEYIESTADDTPYESLFPNETKPVFPHEFNKTSPGSLSMILYHPAGNVITKEFALEAMKGEMLGKDDFTDILAISFSTPDYIGHEYGTHAIETQDIYLRLDRDLAELIKQVEEFVGKEDVLFFLTADHAVIPVPMFLREHKIPAGIFKVSKLKESLNTYLNTKYGTGDWILDVYNDQIYLNHQLINTKKLNYDEICREVARMTGDYDGVAYSLTNADLTTTEFNWGIKSHVQKGYYPKRSGDVIMILEPGLITHKSTGTTHGSPYMYDTHVPLIFYGSGIKPGSTQRHINITDIAPTISQILGIQPPNGCTGEVIEEVISKKGQ